MSDEYYPWGGEFTSVNPTGSVAVVLLNVDFKPTEDIALFGRLKTENIGIEKIIANVISNPHIRFVVLCGEDIRGHQSGKSLFCLHQFGINENHRIIDAPGAIPFIENLDEEAVERFQKQVNIVDLIGETNPDKLHMEIEKIASKKVDSFGKPFIAIQLKQTVHEEFSDKRALHSKIIIDYMGNVKKRSDE
jgi:tetrahydromethanopterin S-methyltransferase subunit A